MADYPIQKTWLPYFVALFGTLFVLILGFLIKFNDQFHLEIAHILEKSLSWLVLLLGISFSILTAALIRLSQLAKQHAFKLMQMNEDLKKEINERAETEEVKQKLEIALLQGQKLQSIGTLAGGIAHDFNNLLYAIIGYIELTRDDVEKDTIAYKNLGKVLEAAHRGQELISRILAFSRRRQHHQFDALDLKSTIEAALSLLRPTIPASVMIYFDTKINPTILGNQTQLHQVLVNLINNAVDAMDAEGTIHISIQEIPAGDAFLKQFHATKFQNYCKIEIKDTGHGMDQQMAERIFEPFFTTKEVGKGTGLGLSIVHSIIKEHQGEIIVTSQLGHGTTFTILLPEYQTIPQ